MPNLVYDPSVRSPMNVAVFLSGSGTNFEALYNEQKRLEGFGNTRCGKIISVFTDVPDCRGARIADGFEIPTARLSSEKIFRELLQMERVPIDSEARKAFDILSIELMEQFGRSDLICLAGYERWLSPYFVQEYRNRILNVHPGDSSKGYIGLGEIPIANAILAGEEYTRSTIFFVDESKDGGPVFVQSHPISIFTSENHVDLEAVQKYAQQNKIYTVRELRVVAKEDTKAQNHLNVLLPRSREHQNRMKQLGDWPSYKFAVHHLIAQCRVAVDGRDVYVDGSKLPPYGFRLDEHQEEFEKSGIVV